MKKRGLGRPRMAGLEECKEIQNQHTWFPSILSSRAVWVQCVQLGYPRVSPFYRPWSSYWWNALVCCPQTWLWKRVRNILVTAAAKGKNFIIYCLYFALTPPRFSSLLPEEYVSVITKELMIIPFTTHSSSCCKDTTNIPWLQFAGYLCCFYIPEPLLFLKAELQWRTVCFICITEVAETISPPQISSLMYAAD